MRIAGETALVTGASRGIGAEFVRQLLERGAQKVYRGVREMPLGSDSDVVQLDVTSDEQVIAAARIASGVRLVVNNAGIASGAPLLDGSMDGIRTNFETNVFGVLRVARAFAPVLRHNGGGALINVLSAASWASARGATSYAASKAAAWSITDGLRLELLDQKTQVLGLHMGPVDTDLMAGANIPKSSPRDIVAAALDGLERGDTEVLADSIAKTVKAGLIHSPSERYRL